MRTRRQAREAVLQILYQFDILSEWTEERLEIYFQIIRPELEKEENPRIQVNCEFIKRSVRGVINSLSDIDTALSLASTNWSVERMPVVDRNILRIAVYEMFYEKDIPAAVSIDEAIEIAKRYGTVDSSVFINGVLDKVLNKSERIESSAEIKAA